MRRISIFIVQIGWLLLLGALAATFFIDRKLIPFDSFLGSVPLGVVWFGALGAVLISLTGIVEHAHDWDDSFALWHLSRPLVGASLAVVGVLILQAGVLATGSNVVAPTTPATTTTTPATTTTTPATTTATPATTPNTPPELPKNLLYYLVAFLVGYREETFRELIKRLVDLIFTPATVRVAPTITGLKPNPGTAAGGVPVKISGSGFTGTISVMFGLNAATFHVDSDGQITAQLPAGTAGQQVTVTVKGKTGAATAPFDYT